MGEDDKEKSVEGVYSRLTEGGLTPANVGIGMLLHEVLGIVYCRVVKILLYDTVNSSSKWLTFKVIELL